MRTNRMDACFSDSDVLALTSGKMDIERGQAHLDRCGDCRALIAAAGMPIAAPSANSFGRPSPTTAAHVLDDLDGRIDAVVDSGPAVHCYESRRLAPTKRSPTRVTTRCDETLVRSVL